MLKYTVLSLYILSLTWLVSAQFVDEGAAFDAAERIAPHARSAQLYINDKFYSFTFLPLNWQSARELCTSRNQVIASVHSHNETLQLMQAMLDNNLLYSDASFWIGGSQLGHIGHWTWVSTGRSISYTNWQDGQPEYWNSQCLELLSDGEWKSDDCNLKRPVICQNLPSCNSYQTTPNA